jgi:hypothetical protein
VRGDAIGLSLTDQIPVIPDFGQIAPIYRITEKLAHFNKHDRRTGSALKHLSLDLAKHLGFEFTYQLKKFRPQIGVFEGGQFLEFALLTDGSNQHKAVPFFEEVN